MKMIILLLLLLSFNASAVVGRTVILKGELKSFDKEIAELKDEKGVIRVPASAIDTRQRKVGQWVTVFVDIVDVVTLNPVPKEDK